jgi:hypothetical protein
MRSRVSWLMRTCGNPVDRLGGLTRQSGSRPRDPALRSPQARAIVGGLLASEPATLFLLPAIQSLIVRDTQGAQSQHSPADKQQRETVHEP